jgi:CRISPR-associated protein Csb1
LQGAFKSVLNHDADPLAKIAPTSLVFGVWDSRDTQAKLPRLIASTIRAYDVHTLSRSAQYVPAVAYVEEGLLPEPADKGAKESYAERGFVHVPATASHGGVVATGGIRRDATLHLAALRLLAAGEGVARTLALQRYILGLALTAFTYPPTGYLRQGCNLVLDSEEPRESYAVYGDGRREDSKLQHAEALAYAKAAAKAFGLDTERQIGAPSGPDREVEFEKNEAMQDLGINAEKKKQKIAKTGK